MAFHISDFVPAFLRGGPTGVRAVEYPSGATSVDLAPAAPLSLGTQREIQRASEELAHLNVEFRRARPQSDERVRLVRQMLQVQRHVRELRAGRSVGPAGTGQGSKATASR